MMTFYSTSARITKVAEDHATDTFIMTMAVPAYLSGGSLNVTLNAGGGYTSLAFPRSKLTPVCLAVISEAQNAAITIKALLTNPPTTVYPRLDIHFFNASGYTNGYDYVSVSTASGVECSLIKY